MIFKSIKNRYMGEEGIERNVWSENGNSKELLELLSSTQMSGVIKIVRTVWSERRNSIIR